MSREKQVEESVLVIAAFWTEGDADDLAKRVAEAIGEFKPHPEAAGSVVCFRRATVEDATFKAILAKLDLAEVSPSYVASFCGGPRADTGGVVETLDPISEVGGEYRFLEIGSDYDAVFEWHPTEEPTDE